MVNKKQAEAAVDTIIRYIEGDNGTLREGLSRTPERVIESFSEIFNGYSEYSSDVLEATFNAE